MFGNFWPKFVKRYAKFAEIAEAGDSRYAQEVRERRFPTAEHLFGDAPRAVIGG
ncbi:3-methyl-2-oxobutanoate hydroxymethyltransferase [Mesorhizobium sp.]|uniref:3-methyl-2-oxobutanoate hydroxymethyltransferase n=1 Tax=Mesorhizobium sp. TaxID=1871066 RepID=UPI0025B928A9|nr:3-methyl-2-oxobutanoate hydroxymethyltransferase [Mesorhizobium sp.]